MHPEVKQRWIAALRSDEYQQGKGKLKQEINGQIGHCCLGVLTDLFIKDYKDSKWEQIKNGSYFHYKGVVGVLHPEVKRWSGINTDNAKFPNNIRIDNACTLTECNDDGMSFERIADIIEKYF